MLYYERVPIWEDSRNTLELYQTRKFTSIVNCPKLFTKFRATIFIFAPSWDHSAREIDWGMAQHGGRKVHHSPIKYINTLWIFLAHL